MSLFKHKIHTSEIIKWGILGGIAECVYIFLLALLFSATGSKQQSPDFILGGLAMMLLLVISVIISAILVFSKPFAFVLKKQIKEAILTFFTTLVTLIVVFAVIIIIAF